MEVSEVSLPATVKALAAVGELERLAKELELLKYICVAANSEVELFSKLSAAGSIEALVGCVDVEAGAVEVVVAVDVVGAVDTVGDIVAALSGPVGTRDPLGIEVAGAVEVVAAGVVVGAATVVVG